MVGMHVGFITPWEVAPAWCHPFAMAIVLEVCNVYTLVMCGPNHRHARNANKNWDCLGCVAGAGRPEIIRVKSKRVTR